MSGGQCSATVLVLVLAVLASGCGTPREKTAPCKRPANLTSYATTENDCGPMRLINPDRAVALAAIQELATVDKE
jgi:hypothetical protein